MDNLKAKKIVIKVFVILIFLILSYIGYWYIKGYLKSEKDISPYEELITKELDLSNPVIDDIIVNKNMGKSTTDEIDLYINVKLPKINAITKETNIINNQIKNQYQEIKNYYNEKEKDLSYEVDYDYKYIWYLRYLYITIKTTEIKGDQSSNIYKTYIYNEKEDMQISMQEVLDYFGATKDKVIKKIQLNENFNPQLNDELYNIDIEKLSLKELNENIGIFIASIGSEEFLITFSLNELNTSGLVTDSISERKNIGNSNLNIKLPKIKLETNTVIKLNEDINKIYNDILLEIGENGNNNSYKINYQYEYSKSLCYLYINIYEVVEKKENDDNIITTNYITYIYDVSGDKIINMEDFLARYKTNDEEIAKKVIEQIDIKNEVIPETKIMESILNKDNISIIRFDEDKVKLRIKIEKDFYEIDIDK